jgi:Icc-related predicted phosphoesterase
MLTGEYDSTTRILPKDYPQMEASLVVSDIHGKNEHLAKELLSLAESEKQPNMVIFLGDIVGTESLDKLQQLFYNGIFNPAKKLQKENSNATNEEILSYQTENNQTILEGVNNLLTFLNNIAPQIEPTDKSELVKAIASYTHFGHFCSNLPIEIRQYLQKDMEDNAKTWIDIMTKFTDKGTFVTVIEGNWDARTPLDFYSTKDKCQPLPEEERQFSFKKLLNSLNSNVVYSDDTTVIETENKRFVLLPFDSAINASEIPQLNEDDERDVVLLSHTQIDWSAIKGDTPMTKEGEIIQSNVRQIINQVKPEKAAHGHLHQEPEKEYKYNGIVVHYLPKGQSQLIKF